MSEHAISNAEGWLAEIRRMVAALTAAPEDVNSDAFDSARQEIEESVLSVSVRDDWHAPGDNTENGPTEYEILLSTGGPALRIFGGLDHGEPDDFPQLQWQDWGTPWTVYPLDGAEREDVQTFARCFYCGE